MIYLYSPVTAHKMADLNRRVRNGRSGSAIELERFRIMTCGMKSAGVVTGIEWDLSWVSLISDADQVFYKVLCSFSSLWCFSHIEMGLSTWGWKHRSNYNSSNTPHHEVMPSIQLSSSSISTSESIFFSHFHTMNFSRLLQVSGIPKGTLLKKKE